MFATLLILACNTNNDADDPYKEGRLVVDDDGDGFLNIFDAFPEDPLKNTDVDHDGIDDSEDSEISQFIPAYEKYLDKNLFFYNP